MPNRKTLSPLVGTPLGHIWTIAHHVGRRRGSPLLGHVEHVTVTLRDPLTKQVQLRAKLHDTPSNPTDVARTTDATGDLVVLIHGLGGSAESGYMLEATAAALELGCAVLRVSLRGADMTGQDFYHAGLYSDVLAVLQHEAVQRYRNVYVLGVSLGGHAVLRAAGSSSLPTNVRAVATLCAPLDLSACSAAFDKKRQWVYRRYILTSLKHMYARFEAAHPTVCRELSLPSAAAARQIRTILEWDQRIVAPRHGFDSAQHYYATQSAGPRLNEIAVPALVLTTRWDPMVPRHTTAHFTTPPSTGPQVAPASPTDKTPNFGAANDSWTLTPLTPWVQHVELATGGHIAFPLQQATGVFTRTLLWLKQHAV